MALINFSGLASGIDSSALIQALLEQQRTARINPLQNRLESLTNTNDSLSSLKSLLSDLQSAASRFRTINGGALSKLAQSSDESVFSATASNSAQSGTYSIDVQQLAKNATFSFDTRFSDPDEVIDPAINDNTSEASRSVSFTIGVGTDAEAVDIVLDSSTTATDFVEQFNAKSDKASASLVNVGTSSSPDYAIVITSNSEGEEDGSITFDNVGAGIDPGIFSSFSLDQATNLQFSVDGISGVVERSSNTVSDLFTGVTFTASGLGEATLSVGIDSSETASSVRSFVEAYNEIVTFLKEENSISRDDSGSEPVITFGSLKGSSVDEGALTAIKNALSGAGISGGAVNILADLGITTDRDGTLAFDEAKLQSALEEDPDAVNQILENVGESLGSVNGTVAQYVQFNGLLSSAISSNEQSINSLQSRITEIEASLGRQEENLIARFSRLEGLIGQLQNSQNALLSLIPS